MWQIDPFGHSYNTPALFGQRYEYVVLNRIGDSIKA